MNDTLATAEIFDDCCLDDENFGKRTYAEDTILEYAEIL